MNLSRSQWITVGVLLLVVIVAVPLLWPTADTRRGLIKAEAAAGATNRTAKAGSAANAALPVHALTRIDRGYVQDRWRIWLADAGRDPFRLNLVKPPPIDGPGSINPRHLKLYATWSQTGSKLAVIDQRICSVGEKIEDFTILRIEPGEVFLQGPEKTDSINFTSYVPRAAPKQGRSLTNLFDIDKLAKP